MIAFHNRFVCAVASFVLAAILLFVAVPCYTMHTYEKVFVVCASRNIEKGSEITEKSLKVVKVGDLNLPEGVVLDLKDAIGKSAAVDIVKGDILMESKLMKTDKGEK